ncbi:MAG: D-aminoacyl-tRNA deacylase [Candidatus Altiarchaeia archaeon]
MPKTVIFSNKDKAGLNIASLLLEEHGIKPIEYDKEILRMDGAVELSGASLCIVASRHKSESGTPTLTAHSPGNYGTAQAGGRERELGYAPALYLRKAAMLLQENKVDGYESCLEATHHGPTGFPFPMVFVEVGSGVKEWNDLSACRVVAGIIAELVSSEPEKAPVAIGFGGGHYCRKFSLVSDYAVGHICPRYNLANLDSAMVKQMISKTVPKPEYALVEKKGLGGEKDRIRKLLSETEMSVKEI